MGLPELSAVRMVPTIFARSHAHTVRLHSGAPPCTASSRPSALKARLAMSCMARGLLSGERDSLIAGQASKPLRSTESEMATLRLI